jgi:hypothetical protein
MARSESKQAMCQQQQQQQKAYDHEEKTYLNSLSIITSTGSLNRAPFWPESPAFSSLIGISPIRTGKAVRYAATFYDNHSREMDYCRPMKRRFHTQ